MSPTYGYSNLFVSNGFATSPSGPCACHLAHPSSSKHPPPPVPHSRQWSTAGVLLLPSACLPAHIPHDHCTEHCTVPSVLYCTAHSTLVRTVNQLHSFLLLAAAAGLHDSEVHHRIAARPGQKLRPSVQFIRGTYVLRCELFVLSHLDNHVDSRANLQI